MNPDVLAKAESLVRELADKLGQPALDVAIMAAWAQVCQEIVDGLIALAVCVLLCWGAALAFRSLLRSADKGEKTPEDEIDVRVIAAVLLSIGGLFAFLLSVSNLASVTAWISLWHPEVWIASKVLFQ